MDATIKLKNGQTLEIYQDAHGESPREWDNICQMVCFHKRYNLGDKHNIDHSDYNSWEQLKSENFDIENDIIVDLYMYEHGDMSIATHPFMCPWDSGQVGFAVITKETIIKEYGEDNLVNRAKAKRCLEAEVETYDQYLKGEVYGYVLLDESGETIDSCFGFYGYDPTTNGIFDSLDIGEEEVA